MIRIAKNVARIMVFFATVEHYTFLFWMSSYCSSDLKAKCLNIFTVYGIYTFKWINAFWDFLIKLVNAFIIISYVIVASPSHLLSMLILTILDVCWRIYLCFCCALCFVEHILMRPVPGLWLPSGQTLSRDYCGRNWPSTSDLIKLWGNQWRKGRYAASPCVALAVHRLYPMDPSQQNRQIESVT
jgi:hypothetical protein